MIVSEKGSHVVVNQAQDSQPGGEDQASELLGPRGGTGGTTA